MQNETNEDKLGYEPETRGLRSTEKEVNDISSRLFDWMEVKGKTTDMPAAASVCEAIDPDFKKYYVMRHPWSVYDLTEGTFNEAMQRIRQKLPENGWKILKDGKANTKAADPEIVAEHPKTHHQIHVTWERSINGSKAMIGVDVDSRCYRAPEGTDLYAEK